MCGIFGVLKLDRGGTQLDDSRFFDALKLQEHRGPDAQKMQRVDESTLLGHARLSIIDLSEDGNQPMLLAGRYWLTYNGEIFNYLELKEELQALGFNFKTASDSEVLLQSYVAWGKNCVLKFNGMWAFAIYDSQEKTLFCSRDRFGEKPFNYAVHDGNFVFSSEIKSMINYFPDLIRPNLGVISNYCRTSVGAQHHETWFQNVLRLPPACNLTVCKGKIDVERYWDYPQPLRAELDFDQAKHEFDKIFVDAVRIRMRSDVPLGLTLSAGIDSNAIAYTMNSIDPTHHHSFTAKFADKEGLKQDGSIYKDSSTAIDESTTANKVALELNLSSHVVETDYGQFVRELTKIIWHLESGNSSPAVFPLMQLLGEAKKKVTVLLEGQGADELLGGYVMSMIGPSFWNNIKLGKLSAAWGDLKSYRATYTVTYAIKMYLRALSNHLPIITYFQQKIQGIHAIFGPKLRGHNRISDFPVHAKSKHGDTILKTLRQQHTGGLVNLLHYGDAISMANSLESRMPFLDYRLVEFVWKLPSNFKFSGGVGKRILREAMRARVPSWILDNKTKYGFTTPIGEQFRKEFGTQNGPVDILTSKRCLERGLFDANGIRKIISAHKKGGVDHGPLLFRLLAVELWFRVFVDGSREDALL